jgi:hypothetical protein
VEIKFTTKEEQKKAQEEAFLALSPEMRFRKFLELSHASRMLFGAPKEEEKGNFVLYHHNYNKKIE